MARQQFLLILFINSLAFEASTPFAQENPCAEIKQNADGSWQKLGENQIIDLSPKLPAQRCQYRGTCYIEAEKAFLDSLLQSSPNPKTSKLKVDITKLTAMSIASESDHDLEYRIHSIINNTGDRDFVSGRSSNYTQRAVIERGKIPTENSLSITLKEFDEMYSEYILDLHKQGVHIAAIRNRLRDKLESYISSSESFISAETLKINDFNYFPHQDIFYSLIIGMSELTRKGQNLTNELQEASTNFSFFEKLYNQLLPKKIRLQARKNILEQPLKPNEKKLILNEITQELVEANDIINNDPAYKLMFKSTTISTAEDLYNIFDQVRSNHIDAEIRLNTAIALEAFAPSFNEVCRFRSKAIAQSIAEQLCSDKILQTGIWSSVVQPKKHPNLSGAGMHALVIKGMGPSPMDGSPVFYVHNSTGVNNQYIRFEDACLIESFTVSESPSSFIIENVPKAKDAHSL